MFFENFRDAIPYGVFMFVYEYLIEKMRSQSLQQSYHYKEETVEAWRTAVAGAMAGMISWLPGIPFDVIKTKMMTENRFKGVYHCYSVIVKVCVFHSSNFEISKANFWVRISRYRNMVTGICSEVELC